MGDSVDIIEPVENPTDATEPVSVEQPSEIVYMSGIRLWLAGLGLALSVVLPALEVSIVSTSLITIGNALNDYDQISWLVTAYLVTYTGFLVIWSKLCDLFGLKPTMFVSMVLFMGFSAGCGAAQSMTQLIIFRAFQGVGGSGLYSITTIGFIQMVPPTRYTQITAVASSLMSLGMILGPLLGGAINDGHHWRWVFYLNVPAGFVALVIVMLTFPKGFPHTHNRDKEKTTPWILQIVKKPDILGAFLLLGASILFVAALEEGGVRFPWNSAIIIVFFTVSGLLWIAFFLWEWYASREGSLVEPMFPWRFFSNRVWMGTLLGCFLSGAPLTIAVIELPQRYQIVNASSPLDAGVKLLAYAAACPLGVVMASMATGRLRFPFVAVMLLGCTLQSVGFGLLSTLPTYTENWNGQYGYSVIAGLGTGSTIGALYMLGPIAVQKKDQALAIGSGLQFRMLGGALGIAVMNTVLNSYINSHLPLLLDGAQLIGVLDSASRIALLPQELQDEVRAVYGQGYNLQMRVTLAFSAAVLFSIALVWKKKPLRLGKDGRLE
ncbi:efflux pump antibiotic resistance protein [Mollisia scopiformis]|uniref:Efflux pump antibiotic resistance protein n=1 Tax=Mollisia scopiformis TaxID=149040 RepID=A0A194X4T9_MOLSC|nr:efflux pump antibiotic resistance protein [Mollisia scopiformis]KUJ15089.1 efflux pump antibiotic resistance protein [Mollisia scopiformis]